MKESENKNIRNSKRFACEEQIGCFRDVITNNFNEVDEVWVYRSCQTLPLSEDDQLPRPIRQDKRNDNRISHKLTEEEVASLSDKEKLKIVGHYALSVNESAEHCKNAAIAQYQRLVKKGKRREELDSYVAERGEYVGLLKITPDVGMLSGFNEYGHANLLLYEGVNLEEYRDKNYVDKIGYNECIE